MAKQIKPTVDPVETKTVKCSKTSSYLKRKIELFTYNISCHIRFLKITITFMFTEVSN